MIKRDYAQQEWLDRPYIVDIDALENRIKGWLYFGAAGLALGYIGARCLFPWLVP